MAQSNIAEVKMGWKALESIINRIIEKLNRDTPIEGEGILISDGVDGKIISVGSRGKSGPGGTTVVSGGATGAQQQLLKADRIEWYGVKWQSLTVVDPTTCAQSSITVLAQTNNNDDFIVIAPLKYPFAVFPS